MTESAHFTEADAALTRRIGLTDLHSDIPLGLLKRRFDGIEGSLRDEWLPKLRAGGVGTIVLAVYIDSIYLPEGALRRAVQLVDATLEEIALASDAIALALEPDDLDRIHAAGKIAALLAFEGAEPLGIDLSGLRLFHRLGLRMLSFAWMRRTAFGDGTWENESRGGLTRLGRAAVREMNRLGLIVDVSHASDETTRDVLATATKPVIASHSNARAVCAHPRNLTGGLIRGIAASGGLVGAVAVAAFIAEREATIERWVAHIDHLVSVAGIDHAGIGADFFRVLMEMGASHEVPVWGMDWGAMPLVFPGMEDYDDLPALTAALLRRGYAEPDLRKLFRDNFVRVWREVAG